MSNIDKQTDLIGESYENYLTMTEPTFMGKNISLPEYIHWIKTDDKFSRKWGLKIEERELRHKERIKMAWPIFFPDSKDENVPDWWNVKGLTMDEKNIPTKLITITYNNETIESYE